MPRKTSVFAVAAVAVAVFWRTAFPTITWWDSSSYTLAASTLGITGPPGSLLLILLGWPVSHLPIGTSPAHVLNLFAGVLAGIATASVYVIGHRLLGMGTSSTGSTATNRATAIGLGMGALAFAFSSTFWKYAVMFTPYMLTVVFTGAILLTLLTWWERAERPDAWRSLLVLGLLFGLDYSVHRTNALLLPGALAWIVIRRARTLREPRMMLAGAGGLAAGLVVQLLVMPISAFTNSEHNFFSPTSLSRFWDYERLSTLGGGFLFSLYPRHSALWSVQFADIFHTLRESFLNVDGSTSVAGALPALAAAFGVVALWKRNRTLTVAFLLLLLLQTLSTVAYFNIPKDFFRSLDRHYLPVCFTIGVLITCGLGSAAQAIVTVLRMSTLTQLATVSLAFAVFPVVQLVENWKQRDSSQIFLARDFANNSLQALPQNAILFTVGDNDTFPLMYIQSVEHVRPDVRIVNMSVLHLDLYPERIRKLDPSFPIRFDTPQRKALLARTRTDTLLTVPVLGETAALGLAANMTAPASVSIKVHPAHGSPFYPGDISVIDIVESNAFRRPITVSTTVGDYSLGWLAPFARFEGLYWRIVPIEHPAIDVTTLRNNLFNTYSSRGYDNPLVDVDPFGRNIGKLYYDAIIELAKAQAATVGKERCVADVRALVRRFPPARMASLDTAGKEAMRGCGNSAN